MFRYLFLLITLSLLPLCTNAAEKHDLSAVLYRLDTLLDAAPHYEQSKLARIATLRNNYSDSKALIDRYNACMQLYDEYHSYQSDSAISVLQKGLSIARSMKRPDLVDDCLSLLAFQSSTAGKYPDSWFILSKVDVSKLRGRGIFYYYRAMQHLYSEIAYYSHVQSVKDSCNAKAGMYLEKVLASVPKNSPDYYQYLCTKTLFNENNPKGALKVCENWLKVVPTNSREFALAAYYMYLIHMTLGDHDESMYWAALSAINDISHAVMDQASLWAIADYISGRDIDRSYKYIKYSWQCATKFGTSVRAAQISPILSVIESEYKDKLDSANHHLVVIIAVIAVLAVVLFFMLFYANRQRHKVAAARNDLHQRNLELADTNKKLSESNGKLQQANDRITAGNAQLKESDQIKEAYIGRFLSLCSDYVNRMDKERKTANRLIKTHKIDELYQMTRSSEQKEKDVEQLYGYFDSTFLNIFPTFVDDFNALLKPENRVEAPSGRLNTTLRIFALIRLGIDDSGKIAEFLNYSVNTIYNYRARTKNGCIGNRDTFEEEVKKLGKI